MAENHTDHVDPDVDTSSPEVDAERERLVAERAARREARLAALAPAPEPDPQADATGPLFAGTPTTEVHTETVTVRQRNTDRFLGSLGLFLLRLVTATIMAFHGMFHLLNLPVTTEMIRGTVLPAPGILAIVLGVGEIAIAIGLVFGLLTRIAGLGLVAVAGGALGFVLWGPWTPFTPGAASFTGELELLLVAVGALFLLVGGGGWAIDHGFRVRRQEAKNA